MPSETYNVGCYLLDRLAEVGVKHMFGVPGDFNLRFLDDVMAHPIEWVGCSNELNAAYAADGYARRRGLGVICTTCGVGELGALGGVAGSAAESVPVIHIAGALSTKSQAGRELVHHTLADGVATHFQRISEEVSCSAVTLTPENPLIEIDRVITDVLYYKRPGYIALPTDIAVMPANPPAAKLVPRAPEFSEDSLAAFKKAAAAKLENAQRPAVLIGHFVDRYGLGTQANKFVENVHIPYAVALLGKGTVNEHLENYVGTYIAGETVCPSKSVIESADVCIILGVLFNDSVTSGFRHQINMANAIEIGPFNCKVGNELFAQIPMAVALKVVEELSLRVHSRWSTAYPEPERFPLPANPEQFDLAHVWNEIQDSIAPNDIVAVDLGTSAFSSVLLRLPENATLVCQFQWAAIGFTLPAVLGLQLAEPDRRVVCIIGDGAAQMTVQELGTIARHHLSPTFLLINNSGYTIERYVRGMKAHYNDIAEWNWKGLAKDLCPKTEPIITTARAPGDVAKVLGSTVEESKRTAITFAEVVVDKYDPPQRFSVPMPGKRPVD